MHFDRQLRLNSSLTPVLEWIHFSFQINDQHTNIKTKALNFGF